MDNAKYLALANQISAFDKVNVLANNVANNSTTGFKGDQVVFEQYLKQDANYKISFPYDVTTMIDLKQGPLSGTGRALDMAISGPGFFMLNTPGGVRYTRNGNFYINAENILVDVHGNPVLSNGGQEISFPANAPAPQVLENGTIILDGATLDIIGVVNFQNPRLLRKTEYGLFASLEPHEVQENPKVMQAMLEGSNTNSIAEMVKLTEAQKSSAMSTNLINDLYNMHKGAYKVYAKVNG